MALAAALVMDRGFLPVEEPVPGVQGHFLSEGCAVCGLDPCGCGIEIDIPADTLPVLSDVEGPLVEHPRFTGQYVEGAPEAAPSDRVAAWRHPAFAAWIDRRDALEAKHGDRAVTHAGRPAAAIARDLKERACALVDRLAARDPDAAAALATIATIGALALALHEKLAAEAEAA